MKRTKKKLELKTQTITTLTARRLDRIRGGDGDPAYTLDCSLDCLDKSGASQTGSVSCYC